MSTRAQWISIMVSMVLANYLYQAFGPHNYYVAFERSYFVVAAVLFVWWRRPWEER